MFVILWLSYQRLQSGFHNCSLYEEEESLAHANGCVSILSFLLQNTEWKSFIIASRYPKIIKDLYKYKIIQIIEGHRTSNHIHLLAEIASKSASSFLEYLKWKNAMRICNLHVNLKYKFGNRNFRATTMWVQLVWIQQRYTNT